MVNVIRRIFLRRIYLRTRQVSDIMLIVLIIQTRSHVQGLDFDTGRIKRSQTPQWRNFKFLPVHLLKSDVLLPARCHELLK
jgi:hypothetical protein